MKQGTLANEASVLRQIVNSGAPLPTTWKECPEINFGLELYWTAYWDLTSTRNRPGGYIAWDKVQLWANTYSLDMDSALELHAIVRALDQVWIDHWQAKEKRGNQGNNKRS